jgi:hypothetical protein
MHMLQPDYTVLHGDMQVGDTVWFLVGPSFHGCRIEQRKVIAKSVAGRIATEERHRRAIYTDTLYYSSFVKAEQALKAKIAVMVKDKMQEYERVLAFARLADALDAAQPRTWNLDARFKDEGRA